MLSALMQPLIHYTLHLLFPGLVAYLFFRKNWKKAWLIMVATMLVDLDHLWSWPDVYVADRCSIGYHPLHTYWAIAGYFVLTWIPSLRIIGIGLLLHMITDWQDCLWMPA